MKLAFFKKLAGWIVKYAPGVLQAIMAAKAKQDEAKDQTPPPADIEK